MKIINNEEDFAKMLLESGGKLVKLNPSSSSTINIFDLDKPEITEELLNQKERDLRALLEEVNKEYMKGSLLAADYLNRFDELPELADNPEWKERAKKIFQEFAEQISVKNLRSRTGMSQGLFAQYMEIPVRTLQEWEQGKRTPSSYIVKMIHRIILLEEERKRSIQEKKVLKEQYTEKDYNREQLMQLCWEKMENSRKDGTIVEFIAQKPVLDENGQVIDVTSDFPAELNVYTYEAPIGRNLEPAIFNPFACDKETMLGCKKGTGKSYISPDLQRKKSDSHVGEQENKERN